MNQPKPTPEQFTHNGNAVRAWEKMERMDVEKAAVRHLTSVGMADTDGFVSRNMKLAFKAGFELAKQQEGEGWISVKERTPKMIEGKDYSENVLAVIDGRLYVLAYCLLQSEDDGWFCGWANCYGDINGDAEYDDDYNPTHWRPLPPPPTK